MPSTYPSVGGCSEKVYISVYVVTNSMSMTASSFIVGTPFQAKTTAPQRPLPERTRALFKRKQKSEPVVEEKPKKGGIFNKKQNGPRSKREAELLAELEK